VIVRCPLGAVVELYWRDGARAAAVQAPPVLWTNPQGVEVRGMRKRVEAEADRATALLLLEDPPDDLSLDVDDIEEPPLGRPPGPDVTAIDLAAQEVEIRREWDKQTGGRPPVGLEYDKYVSAKVMVIDRDGNPLHGISVKTLRRRREALTNADPVSR
jgi:hypothetical protein